MLQEYSVGSDEEDDISEERSISQVDDGISSLYGTLKKEPQKSLSNFSQFQSQAQ